MRRLPARRAFAAPSDECRRSAFRSILTWSAVCSSVAAGIPASVSAEEAHSCESKGEKGPLQVTETCFDPTFNRPIIDERKALVTPSGTHKVSGHFEGTDAKFNFYFPAKTKWQGRFYQVAYPLTDGEANEETLRFGEENGAYTVQTVSPGGYRVEAAAAKYSRIVASEYYGIAPQRIYGYIYGGSGGSYQTIAAIENTDGIWDGAVPFVIGTESSIPNNFFIRVFARLILGPKAHQISRAIQPGGGGDPYVGLDATEASVLREVTGLGVPLRGWDNVNYLLGLGDPKGLLGFADAVKAADPGYAAEFWSEPGYLGTEQSPLGDRIRAQLIDVTMAIDDVVTSDAGKPLRFVISGQAVPEVATILDATLLDPKGTPVGSLAGSFDRATGTFTLAATNKPVILEAVRKGAKLRLDNRWPLALASYHRHQVPTDRDFTAWDQLRDSEGNPRYPQRAIKLGQQISKGVSGGGTHTGEIRGKVIVIGNLLDVDAYPWDGDWYAKRVRASLGSRYSSSFRLWFNDHADHLDGSVKASGPVDTQWVRLINYGGILQQALHDISGWVERGMAPPFSTNYALKDGQITVARAAASRRGIQPTVELSANGRQSAKVAVGVPITLMGEVQVPPDAGKVVKVEWSQSGKDDFIPSPIAGGPRASLKVTKVFSYDKPGTYFPVLRVTAEREGKLSATVRLVRNLARIRVDVE